MYNFIRSCALDNIYWYDRTTPNKPIVIEWTQILTKTWSVTFNYRVTYGGVSTMPCT